MRPSGRQPNDLRNVSITRNYTKHAEGSVLVQSTLVSPNSTNTDPSACLV